MTETLAAQSRRSADGEPADLRRVGINPDFWYPVAVSGSVRRGKTFAARFAGERIALYRSAGGVVYALEDRCAHRQVPLSMGVVEGEALRCCYHAWAYRGDGRISQIRTCPRGPRGRRAGSALTRSARRTAWCSSFLGTRPRRTGCRCLSCRNSTPTGIRP